MICKPRTYRSSLLALVCSELLRNTGLEPPVGEEISKTRFLIQRPESSVISVAKEFHRSVGNKIWIWNSQLNTF